MMASTVAGNVSTTRAPLSANPSKNLLRLRARAPMIASAYTYGRRHILRSGQYALDMTDLPGPLDPQPLPFEQTL